MTKHVARLEDVDLTARLSREEEEKRLHAAQLRLLHLRLHRLLLVREYRSSYTHQADHFSHGHLQLV